MFLKFNKVVAIIRQKRQKEKTEDSFGSLEHFKRMAKQVPAYRLFLESKGFDPETVRKKSDLIHVPVMDKQSYLDKYSLAEVCWDGKLEATDYIVNSSGSTGVPYFWPRTKSSDTVSSRTYQSIFKDIMDLGSGSTLFMNSYGQGSWIAGTEAFLAVREARNQGMQITAINSGIDSDLIIKQMEQLSSYFDNIVFAGYPPFIKDLFEDIKKTGSVLSARQRVFVIVGGESISEPWRAYLKEMLQPVKVEAVISIYGMSDGGGILAYETLCTQKLRSIIFQAIADGPVYDLDILGGMRNTALFQYDPSDRYFEVSESGNLLIHVKHGLPLFKYDTKDKGGVLEYSRLKHISRFKDEVSGINNLHLPFVYLLGRSDYAQTLYGVLIYPEHIRSILDGMHDKDLTGRFVLETHDNEDMNQELRIQIELSEHVKLVGLPNKAQEIADRIYSDLTKYSTEYKKLTESIGLKARPIVHLSENGKIGYTKGKKHKWVKKD